LRKFILLIRFNDIWLLSWPFSFLFCLFLWHVYRGAAFRDTETKCIADWDRAHSLAPDRISSIFLTHINRCLNIFWFISDLMV